MSIDDNYAEADAEKVDRMIEDIEAANALWTMKDGRKIRIADMADSHLLNSIRMLERATKVMEQEALRDGYGMLSTMNGEMAQYCIEQDLNHLESEGADPETFFPIYKHLIREAGSRGLKA